MTSDFGFRATSAGHVGCPLDRLPWGPIVAERTDRAWWSTFDGSMLDWLHGINEYAPTVAAAVALAYTVLAAFQWRAIRRQAAIAREQADLTRQEFDAARRPYVSLTLQEDEGYGPDRGVWWFYTLIVENVGSVPAHVTEWETRADLMTEAGKTTTEGDRGPADVLLGTCIFPRRETVVPLYIPRLTAPSDRPPVKVTVLVKYRGAAERTYQTRVEAIRTPAGVRQRVEAT